MVKLLLSLRDIPVESHEGNISYYKINSIMPISASYHLYIKPYYYNSHYYYRDITKPADFNMLLENKIISKPTSCKKYNIGHYYISTMPRGKQTHTELLPKKVELYNIIDDKYTIEKIIIYSKYATHDLRHSLRFTKQYHSILITTLDFIAVDCEKMLDCYMLTYLPKQKHVIDISGHYEINLSDFNISDMLDHPISSTNDLHIVCSI